MVKPKVKQNRQRTYNVIVRGVRATLVAVEKRLSIEYPECVFVDLAIRHARCMRLIVVCGPVGSTILVSTLSDKRHDFRRKCYWRQYVCFDFPYNFVWNLMTGCPCVIVQPWLISILMHKILVYLHIKHLLKSSTCFEHYPAHIQEVYVVIVYVQPLVSSLSAGDCLVHRLRKNFLNRCIRHSPAESDDNRGCIYTITT